MAGSNADAPDRPTRNSDGPPTRGTDRPPSRSAGRPADQAPDASEPGDGFDEDDQLLPLPPLPPSTRQRRPHDPWLVETPLLRTLSGPDIAGIVLLGALGIGVLVVLGLFVLNRFDQRDPVAASPATSAPAPTPAPRAAASSPASVPATTVPPPARSSPTAIPEVTTPGRIRGVPYTGALQPVTPSGVSASCTDKPSRDGSRTVTSFDAQNVLDGDPETAWRCHGRAIGTTLRVNFDQPTQIAQLGMINGYAKTDPVTRADRYAENRRVTRVRWSLDGDRWIEQKLDSGDSSLQTLRIPVTTTRVIVVQIRASSSGSRNATAIGELQFAGPAGG